MGWVGFEPTMGDPIELQSTALTTQPPPPKLSPANLVILTLRQITHLHNIFICY